MRLGRIALLVLGAWGWGGCAGTVGAAGSDVVSPELPHAAARAAPAEVAVPGSGGGARLYEACRERVEGPSTPGECSSDADCVRTGCSQEVCVAASAAALATTCEILPCFQVLDACSCRDGFCSWSVKEEAPPGRRLPGLGGVPGVPGVPGPVPR